MSDFIQKITSEQHLDYNTKVSNVYRSYNPEENNLINRMIQLEKIVFEKDQVIELEYANLKKIKSFKKDMKNNLKDLYMKLQQKPQILYEKGLFIIDVVIFLKAFSIAMTGSHLHEDFLSEEKDYIIKSAELKLKELNFTDKVDEFCSLFSEFDNIDKAKKTSELLGRKYPVMKGNQLPNVIDIVNSHVKSSATLVKNKQSGYVSMSTIIKEPVLINDFKTNTSYTKWVPVDISRRNSLTCDFGIIKHITSKKEKELISNSNVFDEFGKKHNATSQSLSFAKIKKVEKELLDNLVDAQRNRISELSGQRQKIELSSIKERIKYLFNNHTGGSDVYRSIVNNQKFWERKAMCGTESSKSYLINTSNLEKLRSTTSNKEFSKVVGFAGQS